ncbi:efflux RND transporter periplasmic adaptor subunit [Candidatus Uabimicrobium sp. HlEnr_7]|uniref:efflux RND transporter periplasmic adaptor subunit n=1 Tax=Candidatus Uabimicrobium helgolandensis TaxID=3095367 RepID=UPI0035577593
MRFQGKTCFIFISVALLLASCSEPPRPSKKGKRYIPVEVTTVKEYSLARKARLTGTMLPWKTEELRFQVSGRLAKLHVKSPGKMVLGELKDENGVLIRRGEIIAELDKEPYLLALEETENQRDAAETKLNAARQSLIVSNETIKAAQARVEATKTDIEKIFPLDLKIVREQRKLAEEEYKLTEKAYSKQDTTNSRILQSRTQMLVAQTQEQKLLLAGTLKEKELRTHQGDLSKARVEKDLRLAEIKIHEAEFLHAKAAVKRAKRSLYKCDLRAPFDGVIADINVNPGVLISAATSVFVLAMMDPMRIDVSVSFKKLRDFHVGEEVSIYTLENLNPFNKPEKGILYYLNTAADPSTRTFLAIFAARNYRKDQVESAKNYRHFDQFSSLIYKNPKGGGNLYVDTRCLLKDKKGFYVWKVEGEKSLATTKKVYVKIGKDVANVITWIFRELVNSSGLKENDVLLVANQEDLDKLKDGDSIIRQRSDWVFRPRQLVAIEYASELPEGLYLPADAIIKSQGEPTQSFYVFVIENEITKNGKTTGEAVRRDVIKTKVEDLWKIEDGLKSGEKVVIYGGYRINNRYRPLNKNIPVHINKEIDINNLVEGYALKGSVR